MRADHHSDRGYSALGVHRDLAKKHETSQFEDTGMFIDSDKLRLGQYDGIADNGLVKDLIAAVNSGKVTPRCPICDGKKQRNFAVVKMPQAANMTLFDYPAMMNINIRAGLSVPRE